MKLLKVTTFLLLLAMVMPLTLLAEQKTIVFFCNPGKKDADGVYYEQPTMDFLEDAGYNVIKFYSNTLPQESEDTLDTLRVLADAIVIGRAGGSGDFGSPNKEIWNTIEKPILSLMCWGLRKTGKANWFDTDVCQKVLDNIGVVYNVKIEVPEDPAFTGVDVSSGELPWMIGPWDYIDIADPGNGTALAISPAEYNFAVQFVRFEPGVEFYPGSGDIPAGPRTFMGNGDDSMTDPATGTTLLNYFNFTEEAKQVFLNELAIMVGNNPVKVAPDKTTTVKTHELFQNFPNPFNPTTQISFSLLDKGFVTLKIFNCLGQEMATLVQQYQNAGVYTVDFNANGLSSGIYYYQLKIDDNFSQVRKMTLLK